MAIRQNAGIDTLMPVFNITVINGGVKQNIVPDRCTLKGDRRYIPEEKFSDVCKEMNDAISIVKKKHPDIDLKMSCDNIYAPMLTDMNNPWVKEIKRVADEVTDRDVRCAGAQGSLDVAYAVKVTGLPACCFGIGRRMESNAHADDENIRVEDMVMYTKFLGKLICV
jgi:succinyl-diaminopimelate desuccinylase